MNKNTKWKSENKPHKTVSVCHCSRGRAMVPRALSYLEEREIFSNAAFPMG